MDQLIDALIGGLQSIKANLAELANLEDRVDKANVDLETTNAELSNARHNLESVHAGLNSQQVTAQQEHEQLIFQKQGQLKDLTVKIAAAEQRLAEAETKATSASAKHDQILASLDSLRAKF